MVRGKNPDGTPKRYPWDERRRRQDTRDMVQRAARKIPAVSHWAQNEVILQRLAVIERMRLAGMSAVEISRELGMPLRQVQDDYQRLSDLWLARTARTQDHLRAEAVRRLDNVIRNGLEVLRMDEQYTQAVLFNMPVAVRCPGHQEHHPRDLMLGELAGNADATWGDAFSCIGPHTLYKRVHHDAKDGASYRRVAGQVLQAINSAIMAQARIQGLIIEKKALTDAEGRDLPSALKAILLGEDVPHELPAPAEATPLDIGLA